MNKKNIKYKGTYLCYDPVEPFSNSRPWEMWVQCLNYDNCVSEECIIINSLPMYTCQNYDL